MQKLRFRRAGFSSLLLFTFLGYLGVTSAYADVSPSTFPQGIAFNSGVYSNTVITAAVSQGEAELVTDDANDTVVRHFWIEVFENDKQASKKQTVVFEQVETSFHIALPSGRTLMKVNVVYVVLNAYGRPVGTPSRVEIRRDGADWVQENFTFADTRDFYQNLSLKSKEILHHVTGFLDFNPGMQPVVFKQDILNSLVAVFFNFVPGIAKGMISQVIEKGVTTFSTSFLQSLISNSELKWGREAKVTASKAIQFAPTYKEAGRQTWDALVQNQLGSSVSPASLNRLIWSAQAIFTTNQRSDYSDVAIANYIFRHFQEHPLSTTGEVEQKIASAKQGYRLLVQRTPSIAKSPQGSINAMFDSISQASGNVLPYSLLSDQIYLQGTGNLPDPFIEQVATNLKDVIAIQKYQTFVWDGLWTLAQANPQASSLINSQFKEHFQGVKTTDPVVVILDKRPDILPTPLKDVIVNSITPEGSVPISIDQVKGIYQQQADSVFQQIRNDKAAITNIVTNGIGPHTPDSPWSKDEVNRLLNQANSGVYLCSSVLDLFGAHGLSQEISKVGGSVIQVASAINNFRDFLRNGGDALSGLTSGVASSALTGNFLGAAMNLFSVFGGGGTPDAMIMQQIGQLREEIKQMGQRMEARFDKIDAKLNEIFDSMNSNFEKILIAQKKLSDTLGNIQRQLFLLDAKLSLVERNLLHAIDQLYAKLTAAQELRCLEFDRLAPKELNFTAQTYFDCATFYIGIIRAARTDEKYTLLKGRSYRDSDLINELEFDSSNLERQLSYLIQYVNQKWPSDNFLAPSTVISINEWTKASEGYLQLATKHRSYFLSTPPDALDAYLLPDGDNITGNLDRISAKNTDEGTGSKLFNRLLQNYKEKADNFSRASEDLRAKFQHREAKDYNIIQYYTDEPWTRVPTHAPNIPQQISSCSGNTGVFVPNYQITPPNDYKNAVRPHLVIAEDLELGNLSYCYEAEWADQRRVDHGNGNFRQYGKYSVIFRIRFKGVEIDRYVYKDPHEYEIMWKLPNSQKWAPPDPYFVLSGKWEQANVIKNLIINAQYRVPNDQADRAVVDSLRTKFAALKAEFCKQVSTSIDSGELKSSAMELEGAKQLIQAFLQLGMPYTLKNNERLRAAFGSNRETEAAPRNEVIIGIAELKLLYDHYWRDHTEQLKVGQEVGPPPSGFDTAPIPDNLPTHIKKRIDPLEGALEESIEKLSKGEYQEDYWGASTLRKLQLLRQSYLQ